MVADLIKRFPTIGNRKQVVEIGHVVARPREVLGKRCRLVAIDKAFQPTQMFPVQRPLASDRQADPMQGDRVELPQSPELEMRQAAGAHIVFSMDFEEGRPMRTIDQPIEEIRLEADPRAIGKARGQGNESCPGAGRSMDC